MQINSIWPINRILSGATTPGPERSWEWWQWKGAPHSPKLQHYRSLTIRLFSIISKTLVREGLTPLQRCSQCILQPQLTKPQDTLGGSYPSAEMQSVYSAAPTNFEKKGPSELLFQNGIKQYEHQGESIWQTLIYIDIISRWKCDIYL